MILSKQQARRFERLYTALCAFTLRRAGLLGFAGARGAGMRLTDGDYIDATAYLWGGNRGNGHTDLIRDFVRENPDRLGRADLKVVEGWASGLLAEFDAIRDGADTVFLVGDYGFAVRGVGDELDHTTDLPACLETVLLPIDGLITLGAILDHTACEDEARLEDEGAEIVARMRAGRTLARSAADFARIVGDAREEYRRLVSERPEGLSGGFSDLDLDDGHVDLDDDCADLDDYADKYGEPADVHAEGLAAGLEKGEPTTSLAEVLAAHESHQLMRLLWVTRAGTGLVTGDLDHERLVEALLDEYRPTPRDIVCWALAQGSWHVVDLKNLVEAAGSIRRPAHDMASIKDVPKPVFPLIQVFEVDGDYVATMPDEILATLAGADWDEAAELVADHELALSHLESELDFRGIIEKDEAIDHLIDELPYDVSPALREPLFATVTWCLREMVSVVVTDDDYAVYLVCDEMEEMLSPKGGVACDRTLIDRILGARQGIEPRHVDDLPEYVTVGDYVFGTQAWKALSTHLVYHGMAAAGSAYSLIFGELVCDIVSSTRVSDDAEGAVRDLIAEYGGDVSGDEGDRLIKDFVRSLPRWDLNGWAPADLEG